MSRLAKYAFSTYAVILLLLSFPASAVAALGTFTGTLPDGATFLIEVPSPWNGTLLLYSHGSVIPGSPNPAHDVGDPATGAFRRICLGWFFLCPCWLGDSGGT